MAKLSNKTYPMPEQTQDWQKWITESEKALAEIPEDRLFFTGYADGNAYYFVESFKPLILQHVPYLDAWELPYAHIEGLSASDVKNTINANKSWKKFLNTCK
jgi:hypothetical protein